MHVVRFVIRSVGALAVCALVASALPFGAVRAAVPAHAVGIDPANFDKTCRACDDFFRFATGGWDASHPIPAGHASWGAFDELALHNRDALHAILETDAKLTTAAPGSDEQKLGAFYRSCMDEPAIEAAGTTAIDPLLERIARIDDVPSLVAAIGLVERNGVDAGLRLDSTADTRDSSKTIAAMGLGGLGLPDRDYYFAADPKSQAIRTAYHAYVTAQFVNLGDDAAASAREADGVIALETALAQATPTRVQRRDPLANYHPTTMAQLAVMAPHVQWATYFATYAPPRFESLDVVRPEFLTAYDAQLAQTPLATWKNYLRYHVVNTYAPALPKRFADTSFAFFSGQLRGVSTQLPRWQRCTMAADSSLRDVLGKAYVAQNFTPAAKARAKAMVDNLQATLRADIGQLSWMGPQTRTRAVAKLDAFTKKIGYPDVWQDYSGLTIGDVSYAANTAAVERFNVAREVARIGTVTDRERWGMTPPTVNAYYNPSNNEIVFPAGILEPPFFIADADDAVIYGAIGAVIGHEMTHGFDDQGRQYDEHGNLDNWWTPADAAAFGKRAQCIVDEFNGFEVQPGVHEQGKLVEGEAIADLGGLTIAYKAFEKTPEARAHTRIDGYTPEQRFFLAYAQVWRGSRTDAYTRQLATIDPHPDARFRVIGTLSNMPEFRKAFGCVAGDRMVRANSCQIW